MQVHRRWACLLVWWGWHGESEQSNLPQSLLDCPRPKAVDLSEQHSVVIPWPTLAVFWGRQPWMIWVFSDLKYCAKCQNESHVGAEESKYCRLLRDGGVGKVFGGMWGGQEEEEATSPWRRGLHELWCVCRWSDLTWGCLGMSAPHQIVWERWSWIPCGLEFWLLNTWKNIVTELKHLTYSIPVMCEVEPCLCPLTLLSLSHGICKRRMMVASPELGEAV